MSAAIMGPAVSTFFNPQFSTPFSGAATPLVYLLCLIAILITASGIMEMSARLPSAGAFYTYVTRGLGPRSGFVTGGLMFVAYALLPPAEIGLIGAYASNTIKDEFDVTIHWWVIGLVPAIAMIVLGLRGVRASLRVAIMLFIAEVIVVLGMALIVVFQGGEDGLSIDPLLPSSSPNGTSGLVTGFVFAALSFVGFEAAATLSEEVERPSHNVPRAIFLSVLAVGLLYLFCIWAEVIGTGTDAANALDGSSTPWNDLAATYAPWMKVFVILAALSSMFAVMLNSNTGVVRILHVMGRERMLPRFFAHIDSRHDNPSYAIIFQGIFSIVLAFVVGAAAGGLTDSLGGSNVYGYLGFLLTLGILPVYVLTNVAAIRFFWKQPDFNVVRHALLPGLAVALMVALLFGQIDQQATTPYTWFPYVIIGWVVLLAAVSIWLGRTRPHLLGAAGAVLATGEADNEGSLVDSPQAGDTA